MSSATSQLIGRFAAKLRGSGVSIRPDDNREQLHAFEAHLPKRLPQTFTALLAAYSFSSFHLGGIAFFGWGAGNSDFSGVAPPLKGSLSELLLPAGYIQFGRPDTGSFDAVCFKVSGNQNREYSIVVADHEEILCNFRVKIRQELWPSFRKLVEHVVSSQEQ
jgi:hypothetical protein